MCARWEGYFRKLEQLVLDLERRKNSSESLELPLREKCPYSELFWSLFSRIRTEYGGILCISPYSVRMGGNTDQNNFEYGHFLRSVLQKRVNIALQSSSIIQEVLLEEHSKHNIAKLTRTFQIVYQVRRPELISYQNQNTMSCQLIECCSLNRGSCS